jgi:hypothetical protein
MHDVMMMHKNKRTSKSKKGDFPGRYKEDMKKALYLK